MTAFLPVDPWLAVIVAAGLIFVAALALVGLAALDHQRRELAQAETPRIVADTTAVLPRIKEPRGGKHRRRHRPVRIVRHATPPPPRVEPLRSLLGIWPVVPPRQEGRHG